MAKKRFTSMLYCNQRHKEVFIERVGHPLESLEREGIMCKDAYLKDGSIFCDGEKCKIYEKLK
jgi:hypothetical protein